MKNETVTLDRELACPFCGSKELRQVTDDGIHFTQCKSCEATGPTGFKYGEDGAIDWNTRAALAEPVPPAGGEVEVERYDMSGWGDGMVEREDGAFVYIDDHRAFVTRLQAEIDTWKSTAETFEDFYRKTEAENAALQSELTKAREELDTLRHAVWHALDDSVENAQTGEVTLSRYDFDELSTLVPEEWHDEHHNQSAPAAKDGE